MCLAIYKPATTKPDWTAYQNGFEDNPHGWGFAVISDGELLDATGIGSFDEFRRNFEPYAECQAIIHFRFATHGTKGVENCHPFVYGDLALIHNGIVNICTKADESRSDTYHFMQNVVIPMYERDPDFFLRSEIKYTMELAHAGSKFVLLRADGQHAIWNDDDGILEDDGHWYSNSGYRTSRSWYRGWDWSRGDTSSKSDACAIITPTAKAERDEYDRTWKEWAESLDSDRVQTLHDTEDDEDPTDDYVRKLRNDLMDWGLSRQSIEDIGDVFGWQGLEALWDAR